MLLEELNAQICKCRRCELWKEAKNVVPGEGPSNARIVLVGQNPGAEEDASGRPFVGRSGKFLTKTLAEYGINRDQLFITNIVKHVSPKNRKPTVEETKSCLPFLINQIQIIKPKIVILVGASAKETPREKGIEYFEIIHPSAAMRFTKMRNKFKEQIVTLSKYIQNESKGSIEDS